MFSLFKKQGHTDLQWMGTDIHSHLLPGIDDGVQTLVTSIDFIKKLQALGLSRFIITPHVYDEVYPNTPEIIAAVHHTLTDELRKENIDAYTFAAAEHMLGEQFASLLKNNRLNTFPNNFLLIEMPWLAEPMQLEQTIFEIVTKGYKPIMAHPERYTFYFQKPQAYHRLKELGCLLQLNLLSPTGYYGKEVAKATMYLIKNGLYDLVGTDLHHERHLGKITQYVKSGQAHKDLGGLNLQNQLLFS
ncbi:tyrosine-protein phosphatase [Olivibacter domesticus]|uniref:protein-tyrosine-phosphatase n=1 Tax=Olivibacter domesticus TaxID=407022 RepID=A0A1H7UQL8_OLID1|nr:CpsB/CapC family capsule biosynthesis tyrosine phosphatase [Olivibacter domesticus]SEL98938.1 Tyrosine-protein phosphatase YwqE [Olivibacter domesticus]